MANGHTRLEVRATPSQYDHIWKSARNAGLTLAAYLKLLILRDMDVHRKRSRKNSGKN